MTAPSISEINPANTAEGVVLSDQIYVVFDREVDHSTVQIMLEGPDTDRWSGPEQVRWDDPDKESDDDILASPGYKGMVSGTLSFEKIDEDGNGVSGLDYTGGGSMWFAKITFTPDEPLASNTEYRVWIIGDEESGDNVTSGASTRTVFDTVKGSNLGNGDVYFTGGYDGTALEDIYHVRVKEAGVGSDDLLFQWWRAGAPLTIRELRTRQGSQLLDDGVFVRFDGDFEIDDEFSVQVKIGERMLTTYTWIFTTGAGNIETVPSTVDQSASVPVGGFSSSSSSATTGTFRVISVSPVQRETNIDPSLVGQIVVQFSDDVDADTITDETVEVWSEPVNGNFDINSVETNGELAKVLSVSGDTLIIQIS
jgi:hypothetical protein